MDELGLFRDNSVTQCMLPVEMYGGAPSADLMRAMLEDADTRDAIRERQLDYVTRVAELPSTRSVLRDAIGTAVSGA